MSRATTNDNAAARADGVTPEVVADRCFLPRQATGATAAPPSTFAVRRVLGATTNSASTLVVIGLPSAGSLTIALLLSRVTDSGSAALSLVTLGLASLFVGSAQAVWGEQWQIARRRGESWGALSPAQAVGPLAALLAFLVLATTDLHGGRSVFLLAAPYALLSSTQALLRQRCLVAGRERDVAMAEGAALAVLWSVALLTTVLTEGVHVGSIFVGATAASMTALFFYRFRDNARWGRSPRRHVGALLLEFVGVSIVAQTTLLILATTEALPDVAAVRYFVTCAAPIFLVAAALRLRAYRQAGEGLAAPALSVLLPFSLLGGSMVLVVLFDDLADVVLGTFAPDVLRLWPFLLIYGGTQLLVLGATLVRRRRSAGSPAGWLRPTVEVTAAVAALVAVLAGEGHAAVRLWLATSSSTVVVLLVTIVCLRRPIVPRSRDLTKRTWFEEGAP